MSVQFEDQNQGSGNFGTIPPPTRPNPTQYQALYQSDGDKLTNFLIRMGLAKDARQANILLIVIVVCIILAAVGIYVFSNSKNTDREKEIERLRKLYPVGGKVSLMIR